MASFDQTQSMDNLGMMSDLHFVAMSFGYKFRDFFLPRRNVIKEAGIKPGFTVLDYGCGPGSYVVAASSLVGESGKVYAMDIHPLAIKRVESIVAKRQLTNVVAFTSCGETGLVEASIDVTLLYDTFHDLNDPQGVLAESHRVLKPSGILSFSDHHLKAGEILLQLTVAGLFQLLAKGQKTYTFSKVKADFPL